MNRNMLGGIYAALGVLALLGAEPAAALETESFEVHALLRSYEEVPAVSSPALGEFRARFVPAVSGTDEASAIGTIEWDLRYTGLQAGWREAAIHLGQRGVNGNIVALLCTDLQTVPGFVPLCPVEGMVSGILTPEHVGNLAASQGIGAGELRELLRAMRAGVAYVNLRTEDFGSGEIRGQILSRRRRALP